MSDLLGSDSTETTNSSLNTDTSSAVNNYSSDESATNYNDLLSTLQSALSNYSGDVTDNSTYQAGAQAISNAATDKYTNLANQINDTFGSTSFWSGSPHNNALTSGAEKVTSDLEDNLADYWTDAQTNQSSNYNTILSYLNSLTQSNSDTTTTGSTDTTGSSTKETESGGLSDLLGSVAGSLNWNNILGVKSK